MPSPPARCRESRNVDQIMHEDSSEAIVSEQFAHMTGCKACRIAMVGRRDYPPGCNAPYLGHGAMNFLYLLTLDQASPKSAPEGLLDMRELLMEHRSALEAAGVPPELIAHAIDCPACLIDIRSGREGLRQMHRRPGTAPPTEV